MIRSSWNSVPFNVWLIGTLTKAPISFNFSKIPKSEMFITIVYDHSLWFIDSTLNAIVFLHYRVATKIALEILGYTMCRVRPWWLVSLPLEVSNCYMPGRKGFVLFFSRFCTVRVLFIDYDFLNEFEFFYLELILFDNWPQIFQIAKISKMQFTKLPQS